MSGARGYYLPRGMAVLGLLEAALSFAAISLIVAAADATATVTFPAAVLPIDKPALAIVLTLMLSGTALSVGLYRPDVCANAKRLLSGWCTMFVTFAALVLLAHAAKAGISEAFVGVLLTLVAGWATGIACIRLIHVLVTRRHSLTRHILVVGSHTDLTGLQRRLASLRAHDFEPIMLPEPELCWERLGSLRRLWGVVLLSPPEPGLRETLLDCKMRGMRVLSDAAFQETCLRRIDLDTLTTDGLVTSPGFRAGRLSAAMKRLSDIILASLLLALTLPPMAMVAIAVKCDSPGPVLYRQQRTGRFGRPFTLLKFRSMSANAEAGGTPRWAQKQDPRVTRVGRFIRTTRIDELPQLVNVLRGEMSLVGPRPERPHFVAQLSRAIPFYEQRSYAKPGLTGWAQVNFPYGASVEDAREKLAYDLYYVKNRSFLLDIAILFRTVRVVLSGAGAR